MVAENDMLVWRCDCCGRTVQTVRAVAPDGDSWPAGRACLKCGVGEMVHGPIKMINYDSSKDTLLHIRRVSELLHAVIADFAERASVHDASKLESPEKELFDEYTPLLKSTTYGSSEYNKCLSELKVALDHHYENNSHHPEHHPDGIYGMNLFDLLEMLVDWKAATERHANGDMEKSLDINTGRFGISHELYCILKNTIEYMSKKKEWDK